MSEACVECTGNNVILLLLGELDEVYRIAGNSYCELRIFLGVSLSVQQSLAGEDVYIKVVTAFFNVAVKKFNEVIYLFLIIHSDPPYNSSSSPGSGSVG